MNKEDLNIKNNYLLNQFNDFIDRINLKYHSSDNSFPQLDHSYKNTLSGEFKHLIKLNKTISESKNYFENYSNNMKKKSSINESFNKQLRKNPIISHNSNKAFNRSFVYKRISVKL